MIAKLVFIEIVKEADKNYKRTVWTPEQIYNDFGRRNIGQIDSSKEIHYLCCLERSYIVAYNAQSLGIDTKLVMARIDRAFQPVKLATAVEFKVKEGTFTYIPAITGDKIITDIYPYKITQTDVYKKDVFEIDKNKSWFQNFGISDFSDLSKLISGFNSKEFLDDIVSKNSTKHLEKVLRTISKKRSLYPLTNI